MTRQPEQADQDNGHCGESSADRIHRERLNQSNTPLYGRGGELLPCPFCQCEARVTERHNPMSKWRWSVDCTSSGCGMSGPVETCKADAVSAWNCRALSHPCREVTEEAGEALYRIAYTDGFVDASHPEGYDEAEEAAAIRQIDSTAVADGWANCQDTFLAALSSPLGAQKQGLSSLAPSSLHVDASDVEGLLVEINQTIEALTATGHCGESSSECIARQRRADKTVQGVPGLLRVVRKTLLAALSPLPSAVSEPSGEGWRPIESAPRDGTRVLGYALECGQPSFEVVWWTPQWGFAGGFNEAPTHWQPLPAPPALSAAPSEPQRGGSLPAQDGLPASEQPRGGEQPIPETGERND